MTAAALMAELRNRGVELRVEAEALRFRPMNAVTEELLDALREHKQAVIAALKTDRVPAVPSLSEFVRDWTPRPIPSDAVLIPATVFFPYAKDCLPGDVPDGWSRQGWAQRLLQVAHLCESINPQRAMEHRRTAEELMRPLRGKRDE